MRRAWKATWDVVICSVSPTLGTVVLDFEPRLSVQTTRWREWVILTKPLACANLFMGPLVRYLHLDLNGWFIGNGSENDGPRVGAAIRGP